jgi:hypothetical protein
MKLVTLFILFISLNLLAQPPINERYTIGYDATIFGSVMANDSCYYVLGKGSNQSGYQFQEGAWLRYNFDGSIHSQTMYTYDTLELILWESPNLIQTLDGNFSTFGACNTNYSGGSYKTAFIFIKLKPNGDTLFTSYLNQFTELDNNYCISASQFFQNNDSTYTCIAYVQSLDNYISKTVLFKLSKNGILLWHKYFSGLAPNYYDALNSKSLIKYETNKILIGGSILHTPGNKEDYRFHIKLIMTDTLGDVLWERTYSEDTLNPRCFGLTKTNDSGVLYCGHNGRYDDVSNGFDYKSHITKLDVNFDLEWRLNIGKYKGEILSFRNILAINDSQFVALGNTGANNETEPLYETGLYGWLVKFNINGELLWDRKYIKVPHVSNSATYAKHDLYDVAITKDSGFVMVGQSRSYSSDNIPGPAQQGWLVKVDKHGCLIPNCQQYDNVDTTTTDTTVVQPPVAIPENVLYPNPANTSLYYYHMQTDTTQQQTAYMYNLQGKLVQQFNLSDSNITYSIDVTNFASGVYIFSIKNKNGDFIRREKVIVQH